MEDFSQPKPSTPQLSPSTLLFPPSSLPRRTPTFSSPPHNLSSTPEPKSENDASDESPSKSVIQIHHQLYPNTRMWRPLSPEEQLVAENSRLWPILNPGIRAYIENERNQVYNNLAKHGILKYSTFMALHGRSMENAIPSLVFLTKQTIPSSILENISLTIKVLNLRFSSQSESSDTLLNEYTESVNPGTIIGATDRPTTSFSNGWWVRDCETGSIFNLTAAHPLRTPKSSPPYNWSMYTESLRSQTIDSPPMCIINATTLALRREIMDIQARGGHQHEIDMKMKELEKIRRCISKRDLATVVAAGYGEYATSDEDGKEVHNVEDWSLLRPRSDRVGKNEFPPMATFVRHFNGIGNIEVGMKCVLNGATSGIREGVVMDEIIHHFEDHDKPTRCWVVREKWCGIFGQDGDSGAPIGLQGGLAGGTYITGGTGLFDNGTPFHFSTMTSIKDTFERIQCVIGRTLEIPTEYDLSQKRDRDRYHFEKTGVKRDSHYK